MPDISETIPLHTADTRYPSLSPTIPKKSGGKALRPEL
jgi:hypothetical protein